MIPAEMRALHAAWEEQDAATVAVDAAKGVLEDALVRLENAKLRTAQALRELRATCRAEARAAMPTLPERA